MVCSANSLPEKTPNLKSTTRSKGFVKGIVLKHPFVGRLALHLSNENCVSQTLHILNWQLHPSKEYYEYEHFFLHNAACIFEFKIVFIKHVSYVSDACVHKALHWRNVAAIERRGMFCMDIFFYTLALLIAQKKILRYLPLKRTRLFVNKCIPFWKNIVHVEPDHLFSWRKTASSREVFTEHCVCRRSYLGIWSKKNMTLNLYLKGMINWNPLSRPRIWL